MNVAYVDSSCLVAIAFAEPGGSELAARLTEYDELFSSNLLEAEVRSALVREGVDPASNLISWITWVLPDRPLGPELVRALGAGSLRGPDLWHLATALYLTELPQDLPFLTLDDRQRSVAEAIGFITPV